MNEFLKQLNDSEIELLASYSDQELLNIIKSADSGLAAGLILPGAAAGAALGVQASTKQAKLGIKVLEYQKKWGKDKKKIHVASTAKARAAVLKNAVPYGGKITRAQLIKKMAIKGGAKGALLGGAIGLGAYGLTQINKDDKRQGLDLAL